MFRTGLIRKARNSSAASNLIDVPDIDTALEWATRVPISDKGSVEVRPRLQM